MTVRSGSGDGDGVVVLGDVDHLGAEMHVDMRIFVQGRVQSGLEVRLGERVFEGIPEPVGHRGAAVERGLVVGVVVARPGAGHHDRQHPVDHASLLIHPQGLVVDADRLGLVAGRGAPFQDDDVETVRGEQQCGGHPHRSGAAHGHVVVAGCRSRLHGRPPCRSKLWCGTHASRSLVE